MKIVHFNVLAGVVAFLAVLAMLTAGPANADSLFRPISHQEVSVSTSEASSGVLENGSNAIRAVCSVDCTLAVSATNAAAVVSQPTFIPADVPIYLKKDFGLDSYVRVIAGGAGTLYITEGQLEQ